MFMLLRLAGCGRTDFGLESIHISDISGSSFHVHKVEVHATCLREGSVVVTIFAFTAL
jgi:hypothetical protein